MTDPESEKKALVSKLRDKGTERSIAEEFGADASLLEQKILDALGGT